MVGRVVIFHLDKKAVVPGEVILDVRDAHAINDKGLPALRGVSLNVRRGEIIGVAGVAGNGQRELSQIICGLRKCSQGEVRLGGEIISNRSALVGIRNGMAHIPEDRTHVGTSPNLSVTDNVIMKKYRQPPILRRGLLDMTEAARFANELKQTYDIMVAVQPTRGLDVGAIEGVHRLLLKQREAGAGVLLISEELEELLWLSDRIYVVYEGRIMGEITLKHGEASQEMVDTIGLMMTGTPLERIHPERVTA
jgi:simple sugar transport system ATP-binding protein